MAYKGEQAIKRFCQHINAECPTFRDHIQGISSTDDRNHYAALMLIRLAALYFLQHQGILNDDISYLSTQLERIQHQLGDDKFYRRFLLPLFHNRLSKQCVLPGSESLLRSVPALNIHLFDWHRLERDYPDIQIAGAAFSRLFALFDTYRWQLNELAPAEEQAIHPAVLACLFEQHINQKQTGTYYTKADITAYVAEHTIIPCLFETLRALHPQAFEPGSTIWQLLPRDPDRYIRQAIQHADLLPLETEREYGARRLRYRSLFALLRSGALTSIEEMTTHNLDVLQFVLDVIEQCRETEILQSFYTTLEQVTILDPTCGSGAFLLGAIPVLAALYSACLKQMQALPTEQGQAILQQVEQHPDRDHFILTSILTHNLYGVDLMEEAIDICKLRLQLALFAHTEPGGEITPLPAIDTHIRCGNAVVGSIRPPQETMIGRVPQQQPQAHTPAASSPEASPCLNIDDLQDYMKTDKQDVFHWYIEYKEIMQQGGFDIIIGNPPYIEYSKIRPHYQAHGYESGSCGNLYAAVIERALALCKAGKSFLGLLVPLSLCGSERFARLRALLTTSTGEIWLANFDIFPCRLFDEAYQRLSLLIARHDETAPCRLYTTKIQRWYADERPHLIEQMVYTQAKRAIVPNVFPKLASSIQEDILQKIHELAGGATIASAAQQRPTEHYVYYQEATNYWMKAACRVPFYKKNGIVMKPPHGRFLYFRDERTARTIMTVMNSSLFYLWFATYADGFHLSHTVVKDFPIGNDLFRWDELVRLSRQLEQEIDRYSRKGTRNTKPNGTSSRGGHAIELEEYRMRYSKPVLDEIDAVLARYYGFTGEELAFIIHYDEKYRMRQVE